MEVNDIKCMSLRLQSDTARTIFSTKYLPVISNEDPLVNKAMRRGHELGLGSNRRTHNLEKTSVANLLHGEIGLTWYRQGRDVKKFVQHCGICLRYNKLQCRPKLGPSM